MDKILEKVAGDIAGIFNYPSNSRDIPKVVKILKEWMEEKFICPKSAVMPCSCKRGETMPISSGWEYCPFCGGTL